MNETDNQQIAALKDAVESKEIDQLDELPFDLFEKPNNKTTKLLASSASTDSIKGKNLWYEYRFKEPCIVTHVKINTSGYAGYHEFEFAWRDESGKDRIILGKPDDGVLIFEINDICQRVSFKPPVAWFSQTEIQSVSVEGLARENLSQTLDALAIWTPTKRKL